MPHKMKSLLSPELISTLLTMKDILMEVTPLNWLFAFEGVGVVGGVGRVMAG